MARVCRACRMTPEMFWRMTWPEADAMITELGRGAVEADYDEYLADWHRRRGGKRSER